MAESCCFALYNICRIRSFLTKDATQLLVISRLDYCNSLLAGLSASVTKPLQRVQHAAAHLVYNLHKFTRLLRDLHWLPVVARTRFKTMVLVFKAVSRTAPVYFTVLHQRAGWYRHCWEKTKPAQRSRNCSLFCSLSGGTNSRPTSGQQSRSLPSTKDSRLICSDFTSNPQSMNLSNPPTQKRKVVCTCMFASSALQS